MMHNNNNNTCNSYCIVSDGQAQRPQSWANEFATFDESRPESEKWVEDFENLEVNDPNWVNDFTGTATEEWIKQYQEIMKNNGFMEQPEYQFQQENPFANHPAPFEKGMELFK